MVDPGRARAILGRIAERRDELAPFAAASEAEFLSDRTSVAASKYLVLTAIEDVVSLANHVIASEGWRSPSSASDAFEVLAEHDVVGPGLSERLAAMARFRNLLVHRYADVDDARVHRHLREGLPDFGEFASAVLDAFPELEGEAR